MNKTHTRINGDDYRKLIISAAKSLDENKNEINDLNVFPVPDGDTGSNMSMTVANAAKELAVSEHLPLDVTADVTAKAMLHGARGNSGVIVSLLFRGIAKGLKSTFECDGVAWARALRSGVEAAYGAVANPAEGTILTVARKSAEAAEAAAIENNSFEYVLSVAINAAEVALDETINENPVLEKAGVVDAGGMGWLLVMKAMRDALSVEADEKYVALVEDNERSGADFSAFGTEDIKFAYCTEFILKKYDLDSAPFREYLTGIGDSLVFIDDGEIIKVHVHTNDPHGALDMALKYGEYETVKVENMRTQHTNKLVEGKKRELKKYGFVSVCNGEGLKNMFLELGIDEVVYGGQTMNPSTEDIYKATEAVDAQTVFILPNNKNIILAAEQVKDLSEKNIVVVPTKTVPQGFSAMLGYDEDKAWEENLEDMTECLQNVDTAQITYAVRSTTLEGIEINEGDYLTLLNGRLHTCKDSLEASIKELSVEILSSGKSFISVYYGEDVTEDEANALCELLKGELDSAGIEISLTYGGQSVYYYIISAE